MLGNTTPVVPSRQPGTRKLTQSQLRGLQNAHKRHIIPDRGGWHDTHAAEDWVRPGFETTCPQLRGTELISAVIFMAFRQGKPWTSSDSMIIDDLAARSYGVDYLARQRLGFRPRWLRRVLERLHEGASMPYKDGYINFIGDLLSAKRVGAVSIYMSHKEAGELYRCNEKTFRRWMQVAEDLGVVSQIQTWKRNNKVRPNAHRRWGKIAYIAGPALVEAVGPAIYEGLDESALRGGKRTCNAARRRAQDLRSACLAEFRAARDRNWRAKNRPVAPPPLSSDILPDPPSPFGSEIGGSRSGKIEERPVAAVWPAAPDRGAKLHASPSDGASLSMNQDSPNREPPPPKCTPGHLASKNQDGATRVFSCGSFGDALAALRSTASRAGRGLHLLVFLLIVATTACGTVFDGTRPGDIRSGDRAGARAHGIAFAAGAVGGIAHDTRAARFRYSRRCEGSFAGRSTARAGSNARPRFAPRVDWPVRRPDWKNKQMAENTPETTEQSVTEDTVPDRKRDEFNVHASVVDDCVVMKPDGDDTIVAFDLDRPAVIMSRQLYGIMEDGTKQDAKFIAYAERDDANFQEIMSGEAPTKTLPGTLSSGTHVIRVRSTGAASMYVRLRTRFPDAELLKRRAKVPRSSGTGKPELKPGEGMSELELERRLKDLQSVIDLGKAENSRLRSEVVGLEEDVRLLKHNEAAMSGNLVKKQLRVVALEKLVEALELAHGHAPMEEQTVKGASA